MNEDAAWLGRILAAPEAADLLAALLAFDGPLLMMELPGRDGLRWQAIDNLVNRYSGVGHSGASWSWVVRKALTLAQDAHR
jgi:hypothetical protein